MTDAPAPVPEEWPLVSVIMDSSPVLPRGVNPASSL